MIMQIIAKKIVPLQKGAVIEAYIAGPDGEGKYSVQQITAESLGLHFTDFRQYHADKKIVGKIRDLEISNILRKSSPIFWTYITLEEIIMEQMEYPTILPLDGQVVVTNHITKERRVFGFEKEDTYERLLLRYEFLGAKGSYTIQDSAGNDLASQIIARTPVDAHVYPAKK